MTREWKQQRERSTPFMLRLLVRSALVLGRRVIGVVLWPIAWYFWLTHANARAASHDYLARVLGRKPRAVDVVRHFRQFGAVSVDRVYLLTGHSDVEVANTYGPQGQEVLMSGRGVVLVVAHFGSFEALRVPPLRRRARTVRIVLDREVGRMAMALLEALDAELAAGIIDAARPGPDVMLDVKRALDAGDIVGIMADRARSDERAVVVDFLGGKARLPAGPWMIAATLGVPVALGFGVLRGGRYECTLELFSEKLEMPRATRDAALQAIVQRYAQRLEESVRAAPYDWFNFYDYWLPGSGASQAGGDVTGEPASLSSGATDPSRPSQSGNDAAASPQH